MHKSVDALAADLHHLGLWQAPALAKHLHIYIISSMSNALKRQVTVATTVCFHIIRNLETMHD